MKTALTPEYFALKAFFAYVSDRWLPDIPLAPEERPIAVLEQFEKSSASKATTGLRMAVNDLIEMSSHIKSSELAALDIDLAAAGLLTLTQARVKYSKKLVAILKRGVIRSEVEYYLLRGVVTVVSSGINEQNRNMAENLCHEYEARVLAAS